MSPAPTPPAPAPGATAANGPLVPRPKPHQPGAAPGIEPHELSQLPGRETPVSVTCVDYCEEQSQVQRIDDIADFLARHRPPWSAVRWINIEGLADMEVIRAFAEKYELHPLAVEDVLHTGQRPKAEDYPASEEHPGRLFVVTQLVHEVKGHPSSEQVSLFLGRKTLLTFLEQRCDVFAPILQRIETKGSRLRRSDASFLLYSLLDAVVDRFFPMLEQISERLEELEEAVLEGNGSRQVLRGVHRVKRDLMLLRRVAWPMRELIDKLYREHHECLSDTTRTYLRDVYDHLIQTLDLIESYREFVNSLTEMHMSAASNRLNEIMKTLTVITTIFVPLTFLAGVYGMNMPIPENQFDWTYPVFWVLSVGVAAGMLSWFRRRGWF